MKTKIVSIAVTTLLLSTPMIATASDCDYSKKAMKTNYTPATNQLVLLKWLHIQSQILSTLQ